MKNLTVISIMASVQEIYQAPARREEEGVVQEALQGSMQGDSPKGMCQSNNSAKSFPCS
jgi:hypothetical protein